MSTIGRLNEGPTGCPVQKIGHELHGTSLPLRNQVLMYGLRTESGRTLGVTVDACARAEKTPAQATRDTILIIAMFAEPKTAFRELSQRRGVSN